ncbi:MAG: HAD-IA family hydrolase [Candidatus Aenigmarchaeota archaeon]|nr:HAD-IA family hydrolase [Candidatus Aenigmarchaeota archaeon]
MIKAIILDCDGVILNSNGAFLQLYEKVCRKHGIKEKPHEIYKYFGENPKKILQAIFGKKDVNSLYREYTFFMKAPGFVRKLRPYHGSSIAIKNLSKKYRLSVASGGVSARVKESLKANKLLKYFVVVVAGDDVKKGKPHPEMLHRCMKRMHAKHKETVYVGDAPSDIIAAKRAGIVSVAVLTGVLDRRTAKKMKADYIVSDITKIEKLIESINKT